MAVKKKPTKDDTNEPCKTVALPFPSRASVSAFRRFSKRVQDTTNAIIAEGREAEVLSFPEGVIVVGLRSCAPAPSFVQLEQAHEEPPAEATADPTMEAARERMTAQCAPSPEPLRPQSQYFVRAMLSHMQALSHTPTMTQTLRKELVTTHLQRMSAGVPAHALLEVAEDCDKILRWHEQHGGADTDHWIIEIRDLLKEKIRYAYS